MDFSVITGPVSRFLATAQNGIEVLRYGGLETGAVPSPYQIIESVPMYRLRRYFPPDTRPGSAAPGSPVLMVHPMMMSANMWDVTKEDGAVGILHAAGLDTWVIDYGSPDQVEGGMDRTLTDHIVALSQAIDTVKDYARRYPMAELFYLIGADHVAQLSKWRDASGLAGLVQFAVIPRPDEPPVAAPAAFRVRCLRGVPVGVSASQIRGRVAAGLSIRWIVPSGVDEVIRQHRLYL